MKFRFKLISDEIENFARVIDIDSYATFQDLRNAILDSVGFTKNEVETFYMSDDNWEPLEEIVAVDMGSDSSHDVWLMSQTKLNEMLEEEGQRLMFVFDILSQRTFFMELKEILPGRLESAEVISAVGKAPQQMYDPDELDTKIEEAIKKTQQKGNEDFDEDFYGDSQYSDDELDMSGFDDLTFN